MRIYKCTFYISVRSRNAGRSSSATWPARRIFFYFFFFFLSLSLGGDTSGTDIACFPDDTTLQEEERFLLPGSTITVVVVVVVAKSSLTSLRIRIQSVCAAVHTCVRLTSYS